MKYITHLSRILVGVLFLVSGFIKLNDPVGFSFKLEEYFSLGVLDLPVLMPFALAIAFFVVVFEVLLGVFLLLGYQLKFTLWSLLSMIVFFTFLTFYSAYFNKVTDCGCFGDAIKLTPLGVFYQRHYFTNLDFTAFFREKIFEYFTTNLMDQGSGGFEFFRCCFLWFLGVATPTSHRF